MNTALNTLSNAELVALIQSAAAELAGRPGAAQPTAPASLPAEPLPKPKKPRKPYGVPYPADQEFCTYIKILLQFGKYIKANERQRVAEIAKRYGKWVECQGLPTAYSAGEWRRARDYNRVLRTPVR